MSIYESIKSVGNYWYLKEIFEPYYLYEEYLLEPIFVYIRLLLLSENYTIVNK